MPRSSPFAAHARRARQPRGEGLGLSQLAGLLRRSWRWIVVPTALVTIGADRLRAGGLAALHRRGEDPAGEPRHAPSPAPAQERGEQTQPIDEQAVASQVQVVMSRDLAREAIRRLSLVGNAEFDPGVAGFGPLQRALMMIGLAKNPMERPPEDRVLETYFDRLTVYPAGKSRILTVEFRSKDPRPRGAGRQHHRRTLHRLPGGGQERHRALRLDLARRQHRRPCAPASPRPRPRSRPTAPATG